jgi:hypothetical protein
MASLKGLGMLATTSKKDYLCFHSKYLADENLIDFESDVKKENQENGQEKKICKLTLPL